MTSTLTTDSTTAVDTTAAAQAEPGGPVAVVIELHRNAVAQQGVGGCGQTGDTMHIIWSAYSWPRRIAVSLEGGASSLTPLRASVDGPGLGLRRAIG